MEEGVKACLYRKACINESMGTDPESEARNGRFNKKMNVLQETGDIGIVAEHIARKKTELVEILAGNCGQSIRRGSIGQEEIFAARFFTYS